MDVRKLAFAAIALFVFDVDAQIRTAVGDGAPRVPSPKPAAYNPLAKSTTPYNCAQFRGQTYPMNMQRFCQNLENSYVQGEARRVGRPMPSASIIELPSLGSAEARASGYSCVGGTAMRRLSNGWEQVAAADGGWQRCRER